MTGPLTDEQVAHLHAPCAGQLAAHDLELVTPDMVDLDHLATKETDRER